MKSALLITLLLSNPEYLRGTDVSKLKLPPCLDSNTFICHAQQLFNYLYPSSCLFLRLFVPIKAPRRRTCERLRCMCLEGKQGLCFSDNCRRIVAPKPVKRKEKKDLYLMVPSGNVCLISAGKHEWGLEGNRERVEEDRDSFSGSLFRWWLTHYWPNNEKDFFSVFYCI